MDEKILFVDDDISIINLFKRQFDKRYSIDFAERAETGLDFIDTNGPYAVVIADLKLPGMDGIQFLEKVKEKSPESTRIVLTGNTDLNYAVEAVNKGNIFRYIPKPCKKDDMSKIIDQSLEKYYYELKLRDGSLKDHLTGLWNRRYFDDYIKLAMTSADRYSRHFSVIFIDVNKFKSINDELGHEVGDKILITVAHTLKEGCRKTDIIARYGGDEFVILSEHDNKTGALGLVMRLKKLLTDKKIYNDDSINVSIAAGVATFPDDGLDEISLLQAADQAMYEDKKSEHNRLANSETT